MIMIFQILKYIYEYIYKIYMKNLKLQIWNLNTFSLRTINIIFS